MYCQMREEEPGVQYLLKFTIQDVELEEQHSFLYYVMFLCLVLFMFKL